MRYGAPLKATASRVSAIFLFILVVCDMHLLGLGILSASIYYYILTSYAPFSIYFSIWLPIYCCAMLAGCVCLASAMYLATCMLLYYANRNRGEQRQVPKGRRPQAKNALFSWEPFCCLLGLCLAGCTWTLVLCLTGRSSWDPYRGLDAPQVHRRFYLRAFFKSW